MSVLPAQTIVHGDIRGKNVIIGDRNLQITGDGCRVTVIDPRTLPRPSPVPRPVRVRPRAPEPFVDRDDALRELRELVKTPRIIEVLGPPDIGKTWLVRRLAQEDCAEMPDGGVYFLRPLRGLPLEDVIRDLFDHFFERFSSPEVTYLPTVAELARGLQGLRALVLLDDVDLDEATTRALADYLGASCIVCTRSEPVLPEARVVRLGPVPREFLPALAAQVFARPLDAAEVRALHELAADDTLDTRALLSRIRAIPQAAVREALPEEPSWDHFRAARTPAQRADHRTLLALAVARGKALSFESLAALVTQGDPAEPVERTLFLERLARFVKRDVIIEEAGRSPDSASRFRLRSDVVPRMTKERKFEAMVAAALVYFSEHAAWAASEERAVVLDVLRSATGSALEQRAMHCVRAIEPHLLARGALGSWGEALDHHGRAAQALGDVAQQAWNLHEKGVRALCLDDVSGARALLHQADRLRRAGGGAPGQQLTADALRTIRPSWLKLAPLAVLPLVVLPAVVVLPKLTAPPTIQDEPPTSSMGDLTGSMGGVTGSTGGVTSSTGGTTSSTGAARGPTGGRPSDMSVSSPPRSTGGATSTRGSAKSSTGGTTNSTGVVTSLPPTAKPSPIAFTIQANAKPTTAKSSVNPTTFGGQTCYGALVDLSVSVLPPDTRLKSVRWLVGKRMVDGERVQVLLCSTSTTKPDVYTITVDATDQAGQTESSSVDVTIIPDVPP